MKNLTTILVCGAVLTSARAANAQVQAIHPNYDGSAALNGVIEYLLNTYGAQCGAGDISLFEQGSSAGEWAMCEGYQHSSPMSRRLKASKVCPNSPSADSACAAQATNPTERLLGFETHTITRAATANACTEMNDWQGTLKIIYGGVDGSGSTAACSDQARISMVSNWASIFGGPAGCTDTCTELKHALRRTWQAASTPVFEDLIGISHFCNGGADNDNDDNDPIRRNCTPNERYCPEHPIYGKTLGLVLSVHVPQATSAAAQAGIANNTECQSGNFGYLTLGYEASECPYGGPMVFSSCLYPRAADNSFGCNNRFNNRPFGAVAGWDARFYNTESRRATGQRVFPIPGTQPAATWRLAAGCSNNSSTDQIGCIVGKQACYIGFVGHEPSAQPNTAPVLLAGKSPLDPAALTDGSYPLVRRLYLNTLQGFNTEPFADYQALETCLADPSKVAAAMASAKYTALPADQPLPEESICQ